MCNQLGNIKRVHIWECMKHNGACELITYYVTYMNATQNETGEKLLKKFSFFVLHALLLNDATDAMK